MGLSYLSYLEASSALRISVGKDNTQDQDQIDRASAIIIESVQRILSISGMG